MPVEGQGDASSKGLGFVLLQDGRPVTYTSRALTSAEQKYSQIEKELLAQVFGMEQNHQYVYGREITLWTDHQPLVSIATKPLASTPKRLQRLLLRLQSYDVKICYKPGKEIIEMVLADTLSRAYIPSQNEDRSETEKDTEIVHMASHLAISEPQLKEIQQATSEDETLKDVMRIIIEGWPAKKDGLHARVHPYCHIRDEFATQDGIVFKGHRAVIPEHLRKKIREKLHVAHTGVQSCLRRAREVVYWPGMNKDLTDYIAKCDTCNTFQNNQMKEPLISREIPARPWQFIAADIHTSDDKDYLCTVDCYSNNFEVDRLYHKTAGEVILKLKRHFSTHGIPEKLISDNMPFSSREFDEFAKSYEFERAPSSPEYPQSNGKAENAVKTTKVLMKKAKDAKTDFYLALLEWRNTPSEGMDSSPAQRMFGRHMRTLLPISKQLLKPETQKGVSEELKERKQVQSKHFNRGSKELPELQKNEIVRIQPSKQDRFGHWKKGKVLRKADVRSYIVRRKDGMILTRNRRFLRTSKETFDDIDEDVPDFPSPTKKEQSPGNVNHEREIEIETQTESKEQLDPSEASQSNTTEAHENYEAQETYKPMKTRSRRIINRPDYC